MIPLSTFTNPCFSLKCKVRCQSLEIGSKLVEFGLFYNLRGQVWHFLIETMPLASGASSRWLRSPSDDTTGT